METLLHSLRDVLWGPVLLALLFGAGLFYTIALRALQFRKLSFAVKTLFSFKNKGEVGSISPFQAMMTALAAIVGVGNIAGVATALTIGGVGALFWMWVTGLLGMATSYAENLLSVHYRKSEGKRVLGGPMYYIEKGLRSKFLAVWFAIGGLLSSLGLGNLVQAQSLSDAFSDLFSLPHWLVGVFFSVAIGAVLLGGVRRIGKVAGALVPLMGALYCFSGLAIIIFHYKDVPQAFLQIFQAAFSSEAALGGFAGVTVLQAIRSGVARGIFSNEAGLGSAPIASAQARSAHPCSQALLSMVGTFFSTMIVCTITALVLILSSQGIEGGLDGAPLTMAAFQESLLFGGAVVGISVFFFGFSTSLGWAFYGERCLEYLIGHKGKWWYRCGFCLLLLFGSVSPLNFVWDFADIANALMAFPNLIAILFLYPIVKRETKSFFS